MSEQKAIIETKDLVKIYNGEVHALDGVSLSIRAGEFVSVMGPSGSGKSTLLNMIGALERPTGGEVWVEGENLGRLRKVDTFRSRTVGFVFQMHNLLPTLSALENVMVPMLELPLRRGERRERAERLLGLVDMGARARHLPSRMSGGERQRVAIARALANQSRLLLADEPTGNLDTAGGMALMRLFQELNRSQGTTVIVVTHDPMVARSAERVIYLVDGRVVRDQRLGDPFIEDLRQFKASPLAQELLQGRCPASMQDLGVDEWTPALRKVLNRI